MNAHRDARDLRTLLQDHREGIASVGRVILRVQARDVVVGLRAIGPLIGQRPEAELELQPARGCLRHDKAQHLHVALAFARSERHDIHFVSGNGHQVRERIMEVVAGHTFRKVIAEAESKVEAVEPAGHQAIQVTAPEIFAVIPALVFDVATEGARRAAYLIGGRLTCRLVEMKTKRGVAAHFHAICQVRQPIDETQNPSRRDPEGIHVIDASAYNGHAFRMRGPLGWCCKSLWPRALPRHYDEKAAILGVRKRGNDLRIGSLVRKGRLKTPHRPAYGGRGGHGIVAVHNQMNCLRGKCRCARGGRSDGCGSGELQKFTTCNRGTGHGRTTRIQNCAAGRRLAHLDQTLQSDFDLDW